MFSGLADEDVEPPGGEVGPVGEAAGLCEDVGLREEVGGLLYVSPAGRGLRLVFVRSLLVWWFHETCLGRYVELS